MAQRYFIKLSYDGTDYHGWQQQPNALSIEDVLTKAIRTILREDIKLTGCGRTDTGVHAKEFYAHFDLENMLENLEEAVYKLTCLLPDPIVIDKIFRVRNDAHVRFSAISRTYQYFINSKRDPFNKDYEYFFSRKLDLDLMNDACDILMKHKNFSSFSKTHTQVNNYLCNIMEASWNTDGSRSIFTITANRFLRNMVRAVVGTMLEVGMRKITLKDFNKIIEGGSRSDAGTSVPAKGLFLCRIRYPEEIFFIS